MQIDSKSDGDSGYRYYCRNGSSESRYRLKIFQQVSLGKKTHFDSISSSSSSRNSYNSNKNSHGVVVTIVLRVLVLVNIDSQAECPLKYTEILCV